MVQRVLHMLAMNRFGNHVHRNAMLVHNRALNEACVSWFRDNSQQPRREPNPRKRLRTGEAVRSQGQGGS